MRCTMVVNWTDHHIAHLFGVWMASRVRCFLPLLLCVTTPTAAEKNDVKAGWYSQACDVLGLSPPAPPHPIWTGNRLEGVCPRGCAVLFLLQCSVYTLSVEGRSETMLLSAALTTPRSDFPLTQGGVAAPRCYCADDDAFNESSAGLGEGPLFSFSFSFF